jgi:hypothetical protein
MPDFSAVGVVSIADFCSFTLGAADFIMFSGVDDAKPTLFLTINALDCMIVLMSRSAISSKLTVRILAVNVFFIIISSLSQSAFYASSI